MTTTATRKLFVNLPVRDLDRSKAFFAKLGFAFDPKYTSADCACMIVSGEAWIMLLTEARFKDFARKPIADATRQTQGLFCLSAASRAEVDQLVKTALEAGGSPAADVMDHGFMYGWSFYDPDGHHWEVMWMDPAAIVADKLPDVEPAA